MQPKQGAAGCFDEHENEAPFQEAAKRFLSQNSFSLLSYETLITETGIRTENGGVARVPPVEYQNGPFLRQGKVSELPVLRFSETHLGAENPFS